MDDPIQDLLNKIKWDPKENPEEYVLFYYDRIDKDLKQIRFEDIVDIKGEMLIVNLSGKETVIPVHRFRKVLK